MQDSFLFLKSTIFGNTRFFLPNDILLYAALLSKYIGIHLFYIPVSSPLFSSASLSHSISEVSQITS